MLTGIFVTLTCVLMAQATGLNLPVKSEILVKDGFLGGEGSESSAKIPGNPFSQVKITNTSCGEANGRVTFNADRETGFSYSRDGLYFQPESTFNNLTAGNFMFYAKDRNGWMDSIYLEIKPSDLPEIDEIILAPEKCNAQNGSITISASRGAGTFQYSLDGNSFQLSNTFTNLTAGSYIVHVLDNDGCVNMTSVELEDHPGILIRNISSTPSLCGENTGSLELEIAGGIEPIMVSLNNESPAPAEEFTALPAGDYYVHIQDATGCSTDTLITISRTGCPVYIPNIFSPNGDGVNDVFQVQTADQNNVLITRFFIFDKWGNNVYERYNLPIHSKEGWWDGTYKRFTSNAGTFTYYLEVAFENGQRETYKGKASLVR